MERATIEKATETTHQQLNSPPPPRISIGLLWQQFLEVMNFERGFLYTTRELLLRPAATVKQYLFVDRSRTGKAFQPAAAFYCPGCVFYLVVL